MLSVSECIKDIKQTEYQGCILRTPGTLASRTCWTGGTLASRTCWTGVGGGLLVKGYSRVEGR